jgi:hypothetical protein
MGGSSTADQLGTYISLGSPGVPGARVGANGWTDSAGNFWLFGGLGSGYFNDLWKLDPTTLVWTWVSGSSTPNQFGVYTTYGTPAATNVPGSRSQATTWIDKNGNLVLFGGYGYDDGEDETPWGNIDNGNLNDLWRFTPSIGEWTWIGGSQTLDGNACAYPTYYYSCGVPGYYGSFQAPSTGNAPGGRYGATGWTIPNGDLWLFGGLGNDSSLYSGYLNDLWLGGTTDVSPPVFSEGTGTYQGSQSITITDAIAGAIIRYTTDGTVPTDESPKYTGPILIAFSGVKLSAFATGPGLLESTTTTASYTISPSSRSQIRLPGRLSTTPSIRLRHRIQQSIPLRFRSQRARRSMQSQLERATQTVPLPLPLTP